MATRPSTEWRAGIAEEVDLVKSGSLAPEDAVLEELYPPSLLLDFDQIFDSFEREVAELGDPTDQAVLLVIQRVVLALNSLNDDYDSDAIATDGRTKLCVYIDQALTEANVDLDALSARGGIPREDLTDEWRTW